MADERISDVRALHQNHIGVMLVIFKSNEPLSVF